MPNTQNPMACPQCYAILDHGTIFGSALALLQDRIAACETQLQQLDEQVLSLKGEFESKKSLEIELKSSLNKAEATLTAASALLGKLSGEKNRWETQVRSALPVRMHCLSVPLHALLALSLQRE